MKDADNAAAAFTDYCLRMGEQPEKTHEEETEFYNAFLYLANYHIKKGQYDDAYSYAFKCLEFDEVRVFLFSLLSKNIKICNISFLMLMTVSQLKKLV